MNLSFLLEWIDICQTALVLHLFYLYICIYTYCYLTAKEDGNNSSLGEMIIHFDIS